MAIVTTEPDIALLRESGRILSTTLKAVAKMVEPGIATEELDQIALKKIRAAKAEPSFLNYQGYPASLCVSINSEVVHGIPSSRRIKNGDVVSLDLGVNYRGWFTDAALSIGVGDVAGELKKLLTVTKLSLTKAIESIQVDGHIGDIGAAVESVVKPHGFGIVQQLCGHGVGRAVHEPPQIPNFVRPGAGPVITTGMILAIEPMITLGDPAVQTEADEWTVVTCDGQPAAHFEHTVLVTPTGAEIITL
jgi:methionyl aminopeptidase